MEPKLAIVLHLARLCCSGVGSNPHTHTHTHRPAACAASPACVWFASSTRAHTHAHTCYWPSAFHSRRHAAADVHGGRVVLVRSPGSRVLYHNDSRPFSFSSLIHVKAFPVDLRGDSAPCGPIFCVWGLDFDAPVQPGLLRQIGRP